MGLIVRNKCVNLISPSFRQLYPRSSLNGTQTKNLLHVRKWARFENACPKFGVPLPLQTVGLPILSLFLSNSQIRSKLNGDIFGTKHDTDNQETALETTNGPLQCCKISRSLVHQRRKVLPSFYPPRRLLFGFIAGCFGTQPNFAKR